MMAASTTAGPPECNGETHIASGNVHDLTDPVHVPKFEGNVPDTHSSTRRQSQQLSWCSGSQLPHRILLQATLLIASVAKEAAENRIVVELRVIPAGILDCISATLARSEAAL
jgi:hypothetical protein